jgi:putative acetyltransferase
VALADGETSCSGLRSSRLQTTWIVSAPSSRARLVWSTSSFFAIEAATADRNDAAMNRTAGRSRDEIARLVEENLWATWSNFGRAPGCSLHDEGDLLWFETPIPFHPSNTILEFQVERDVDRRIDELLRHLATRGVPVLWIVHPSGRPDSSTRMWMAYKDGAPISKVGLYDGRGSAGIDAVATKPEARGLGIATILMVVAMRAAKAMGHEVVVLDSSPMAEKLYQRLGFVTVANFRLFADVPASL